MSGSLYKSLNRDVGKAIHQYDMISNGDRILVAVSGGKDSLTLMRVLQERFTRIPISYELFGIYIDPGFNDGYADALRSWAERSGFHLRVEFTNNGILAHGRDNSENPCFLCARLRRKRIFEIAKQLACNKIALGHHKDDIIETFFINICYAGIMSAMRPSLSLFDGQLTIIRPLSFVDEERILKFAKSQHFPEFNNPCPSAKSSKRNEIKTLLNQLYLNNHNIKGNIFRSLSHVNKEYLL
jgi:tRNA 2-thiocytidine biosynthesis protein TtcA